MPAVPYMSKPAKYRRISKSLADWFEKNREPYFFRENRSAYKVWISEVALQQTRIQAALPKLESFLEKFPDVEALAKSTEDAVVQAWSGLGYYNRARNLRKGAIYLMTQLNGAMPQTSNELEQVPSIGRYTAAIISSVCFGEPRAAIDGNVKRVLARLWLIDSTYDSESFQSEIATHSETLMMQHQGNPGVLNEAIMEFGQKICGKAPQCHKCFLRKECEAYARQSQNSLPVRAHIRTKENLLWQMFLIQADEAFVIQKFLDFPFLKNHWGVPSRIVFADQRVCESSPMVKKFANLSGKQAEHRFSHAIMHYKITADVSLVKINMKNLELPPDHVLMPASEMQQNLASSLMKKAVKIVM